MLACGGKRGPLRLLPLISRPCSESGQPLPNPAAQNPGRQGRRAATAPLHYLQGPATKPGQRGPGLDARSAMNCMAKTWAERRGTSARLRRTAWGSGSAARGQAGARRGIVTAGSLSLEAVWALVAALLCLRAVAADADARSARPTGGEMPSYQVEGLLTMTSYASDGRVLWMRYDFLLAVSGQVWKIVCVDTGLRQIVPEITSSPSTFRHLKVYSDGLDCYGLHYYSSNRAVPFRPGPEDFDLGGSVAKGPVPADAGLKVLWMALASGYALDHSKDLVLPHPWEAGYLPPRSTNYQAVVERAVQPPRLPIKVVYRFPGSFYDERGQLVSEPKPYDEGWVFAEYHVLRTTNCGSLTLPLSAIFQHFARKDRAYTKEDTRLVSDYSLHVVSALPTAPALAEPPVTGIITVRDYRFEESHPRVGPFTVSITNENWLPVDHPILLSKLQEAQSAAAQREKGPSPAQVRRVRLVFAVVAGASALGPALLLWRSRKARTREGQ